jgi:putative heme-binding domain-containing protein
MSFPDRFSNSPWTDGLRLLGSVLAILAVAIAARAEEDWRPAEPKSPTEWYGQTIRESAWRSPSDEAVGFHLPSGFRVELVACEPEIAKPMNLAFDAQGRLWMTQSVLYPFPSKDGSGTGDAVMVLEDRDRDGGYEIKRRFADGLNIPIGILPYEDGCLVFSIPNILRLRDTDGDGVCDSREVVLGPFDTSRDTHGMVNALRDGGDGWIYACHGFNNISRLVGKDGHTIELVSGNTFRFRPDGSRVEQYTQGQVNPFGMTRDPYGNWFTADCHSKPLTQLLRGACYPSFGRPDDGLGFVPPMMEHLHGSTAISGAAVVRDGTFPDSFRGDLFCGNVMTCRINRNRITYQGATAKAHEMPDLLTSDDPWFRPVDLQFGPDGCLYVADFYNKIIGHYEVPLDHPDRDRTSGRIWRIRWIGDSEQVDAPKLMQGKPALVAVGSIEQAEGILATAVDPADTVSALNRLRAAEFLGASGSMASLQSLAASVKTVDPQFDPILSQGHWIAMRDIARRETERNGPKPRDRVGELENGLSPEEWVKILRAIRNPAAASWTLEILERHAAPAADGSQAPWVRESLMHAATIASDAEIPRVLALLERTLPDRSSRMQQILLIAEAQRSRNGKLSAPLLELGRQAIDEAIAGWGLRFSDSALHTWTGRSDRGRDERAWPLEKRSVSTERSDSPATLDVWSSIGLGERYTGTWTSSPWKAQDIVEFWIVGHNGLPNQPDERGNYVRLLLQNSETKDWKEIERYYPPRSDTAQRVAIDLSGHRGSLMRLQVVDGDGHDAYAWIAIGGVSLPGLALGPQRDAFDQLLRMARCFGSSVVSKSEDPAFAATLARWHRWLEQSGLDPACRTALQKGMLGSDEPLVGELLECIVSRGWEDLLDAQPTIKDARGADQPLPRFTWAWRELNPGTFRWLAEQACRRSDAASQEELALRWSKHRSAIPWIESLMRSGAMSKEVLRALPPAWWDGLSAADQERMASLKPEGESDAARVEIVQAKAAAVAARSPDLTVGARVFQERCATCHQLAGQGKVIGPQLDGAITRTVERLCEDILWPNRNVDEAFRITNVLTHSGETFSGLIIDRRDDSLELVDQAGKSQRIARDEIEAERISKLSLMPGNFEELVSDAEFASLIGFLKSHSPKP